MYKQWNQNLKVRKVTKKKKKKKQKQCSFKRKWENVTWPSNICLLILCIHTSEHYI